MNERQVILCQSTIRGFLVRRRMRKVDEEFQRIVAEIEGAPAASNHSHPKKHLTDSVKSRSIVVSKESSPTTNADLPRAVTTEIVEVESSPNNPVSASDISENSSPIASEEPTLAQFEEGLGSLSVEELEELKVKTAFELLWIHDSVQTRKDYLRS